VNVAYSLNGINWTAYAISAISTNVVNGLVWTGTTWVLGVQGSPRIMYTTSPVPTAAANWVSSSSAGTLFASANVNSLTYGNGIVVAGLSASPWLAWSTNNGVTWAAGTGTLFSTNCGVVYFGGTRFLAGGSGTNQMMTSTDGKAWTAVSSGNSAFTTSVIGLGYNGSVWLAGGTGTNTLAYSMNGGTTWVGLGTSIFTSGATAFSWNGLQWNAGGSGGATFGFSKDGINWTTSSTIITGSVLGLASRAKLLPNTSAVNPSRINQPLTEMFSVVAGGVGAGRIYYSYDQITWIQCPGAQSVFSTGCYSVAWNGSLWVAVGNGTNTIAYSIDGINWTGVSGSTSIFTTQGGAVGWNGTMWVVAGMGTNGAAYSYDGITWTAASGVGTAVSPNSIVWNGTMWMIPGGGTGVCFYSYDGIIWSSTTAPFNVCYGLVWTGSRWIGTGGNAATSSIAYSSDGFVWTNLGFTYFTNGGEGLATNGTVTVAGCMPPNTNNFSAYYSTDNGVTWIGLPSVNALLGGTTREIRSIIWTGQYFFLFAITANIVLFSPDGINWQVHPTLTPIVNNISVLGCGIASRRVVNWTAPAVPTTALPAVLRTNMAQTENFMVGGGGTTTTSRVGYTYDGMTWYGSATGNTVFTTSMNAVAYNDQMWVGTGIGGNTLAYSPNGTTWYGAGSTLTTNGYCVAWNGTMWVAGGGAAAGTTLCYSYNGTSWTASTSGNAVFTTNCTGVAWNGSLWVAVGSGTNTIAYSYDGINWTGIGTTIFSTSGLCIGWNGTYWVAGGSGTNTFAYSTTGITSGSWTGTSSVLTTQVNSLAWNGYVWVAAGSGTNRLAYSTNSTSWTAGTNQGTILSTSGNSVAWNGNYFVAGGAGTNSMAYSSDGITWAQHRLGTIMFGSANSVLALASRRPLPMLGVTVAPRRTLYGTGTTSGGTLAVTFSPVIFSGVPVVTANVTGTTAGIITISSISATGFTANTFNTSGTLTNFSFNWVAVL
jgi:hypothetical protein